MLLSLRIYCSKPLAAKVENSWNPFSLIVPSNCIILSNATVNIVTSFNNVSGGAT